MPRKSGRESFLRKKKVTEVEISDDIKAVRARLRQERSQGKTIGFVPTMGALHKAHAQLIKRAVSENDFSVVSIFVNPTQFGPDEDFKTYPGDFDADTALCDSAAVDTVFHPSVETLYKEDESTRVVVSGITDTMCGKTRPGHFEGVATIVSKLFNIIEPHRVYLGQKDYQQFRVIERMVKDLDFDIELVMCPTEREDDGLAVSSRNRYLDDKERKQSAYIYKALKKGKEMILAGERDAGAVSRKITEIITGNIDAQGIDYAGVFDAYTLKPVGEIKKDIVLAAAVRLGRARLIDNTIVEVS
ncbi:MAG: pantoate--beta-alanine ligase [Elusimicrobiota bacterium]